MNKDQIQHCHDILVRLDERGFHIGQGPLTPELVRAVITAGNDLVNEAVLGPAGLPGLGVEDSEVMRTFRIVSRREAPPDPLMRVQVIMVALDQAIAEALNAPAAD